MRRFLRHRAALRLLRHLFATVVGDGPRTRDDMVIEAFLWDVYGDHRLAERIRNAAPDRYDITGEIPVVGTKLSGCSGSSSSPSSSSSSPPAH
jgi:hypothetical protein